MENEGLDPDEFDEDEQEALTSQLIPLEKKLWEISSYRDFLVARRKNIAEAINRFMKEFE